MKKHILVPVALLSTWLLPCGAAYADRSEHGGASQFFLFLSADYLERIDATREATQESDFTPAVDLLYSYSRGPWRFLGEYLWTDDESELERIQVGYDASADSTFWIGRFHQPSRGWAARYHHGRFLQTSIARPAIEEWEDDGGIVPTHISGVMLEHGIPLENGNGSRISLAIGVGPYIKDQDLIPFDFANPNDGKHGLSASLTFAYFPDYLSDTNFGISLSHSQIVVLPAPSLGILQAFDINQTLLSAQVDWENRDWQILAAGYYVHNSTEDPGGRFGGWFSAAYGEVQRTISERSIAYARIEVSQKVDSARFTRLFHDVVKNRVVIGYRYEFLRNQAVTVEFSDESWLTDSFRQARIQWSSVFP